jgi:Ni,Fe-hydrogenase III large subunit
MKLDALRLVPLPLAAPIPARRARVGSGELLSVCRVAREAGATLGALWVADDSDRGEGFCLRVLLAADDGLLLLEHRLPDASSRYPDLAGVFPCAARMQRAVFDLTGISAQADDDRPWLWMAAWPIDRFPLRRDFATSPDWQPGDEDYRFVRVEGEGVHEIAVGPVHAGTIEPGHFRFQAVGEKVLRLEERLGYTHKGVEKRFTTLPIAGAPRLAGRLCGDSTVAYAWSFAQALEGIAGVAPPPRAQWLRALALERERIANHLGDLGALGNDAGLAFGLAQFSRLREDVLRTHRAAFGHRLMMDFVVPGGVAADLADAHLSAMRDECARIAREAQAMRGIYDEHSGVQDRFRTCGRVAPDLAKKLGMTGLAARASGGTRDLRADFPGVPYAALGMRAMRREEGDVAARVAVRFDELFESLRLVGAIADALPAGAIVTPMPPRLPAGLALGIVEGWRGPVTFAVETDADGAIRRCHPHYPSWQNWPAVEHAALGNIVPDFPLINKSFNLAYSGHDL